MRNIFDQYSEYENKLTHSLMSCLNEDRNLLNSFFELIKFKPKITESSEIIINEQSLPDQELIFNKDEEEDNKRLPDGIIYDKKNSDGNNKWIVIIESKISKGDSELGGLCPNQLKGHLQTVIRRGYSESKIVGITITLKMPNKESKESFNGKWKHLTWKEIYGWGVSNHSKSKWAKHLTSYFEVIERKMISEEKNNLVGSVLTMFTGIPFHKEEYSDYQAKRIINLLMDKLESKDLKKHGLCVGDGLKKKKNTGTWNIIMFEKFRNNDHTKVPHCTFAILRDKLGCYVTIPDKAKVEFRYLFKKDKWDKFKQIIEGVVGNMTEKFSDEPGMRPVIKIIQRRYINRTSEFREAELILDMRTAFPNKKKRNPDKRNPVIKSQPEWLSSVFEVMTNKKANIQFQIGVEFPYIQNGSVAKENADQLIIDSLISCKPFTDAIGV